MPVNEEIAEEPKDPRVERFIERSRGVIGASDRMPVRVIVLFILTIGALTFAPVPANIVGVVAVVLLALDTSQHRR